MQGRLDLQRGLSKLVDMAAKNFCLPISLRAVYLPPSVNPRSFRSTAARRRIMTGARVSVRMKTTKGMYAPIATTILALVRVPSATLPAELTHLYPLDPSPPQIWPCFDPAHGDGSETGEEHGHECEQSHR